MGTNEVKSAHQEEVYTKKEFFNILVQLYLGQMKRQNFYKDDSPRRIHEMAVSKIESLIEKDPERKDYYSEMIEIAKNFYSFVLNPELRNEVIEHNVKTTDFTRLYGEEILGDHKRKYDMSELFREDYITQAKDKENGKLKRKVAYREHSNYVSHEYTDRKGNNVIVEEIGTLYMEQWNGIRSDVSKYRIHKQIGEDNYIVYEVFSKIRICDMEQPEYKDAVLQELLSDNNMTLANAGGYIGEIVQTPQELKDATTGEQTKLAGTSYFYKVGDKYSLEYDATDLSAVMLHDIDNRNKQKELIEHKKEIMELKPSEGNAEER